MTIIEFIKTVLINEIGDIVDRHKYLSFGVVSQGIELLGACVAKEFLSIKRWRFQSNQNDASILK